MGSGDLNLLKSWNPKLVKNRKKVWENEQQLLIEETKLQERKKEIEKERQFNELLDANREGESNKKKQTGLEWMYSHEFKDEKEDYLLGKKKLDASVIKRQEEEEEAKDKVVSDTSSKSNKKQIDFSSEDPMSKLKQAYKQQKRKTTMTSKKPTNKIEKAASGTRKGPNPFIKKQRNTNNGLDY
ncbi:hypothetical protein NCAS_0A00820 [Naumovozyma castellii]|uniref:Pre-mRNA-splicing factor CWC25 n=1 Tax=Naumovozyma castellii TaxID=27288 RepID=G0V5A6_NAUCA|nr:hypothetical protein NCAS_0A00820 [Naumovozyma castellii CBS 4309]CCC66642.1 hypothetical protein NCAS_0A00820 [Naumovozyma castellii CBS 4309]